MREASASPSVTPASAYDSFERPRNGSNRERRNYLGFGLPALGVGITATYVGLYAAICYASIILGIIGVTTLLLLAHPIMSNVLVGK
jgi:hypothetical protein